MEEQDLLGLETWHSLFDELCNRAGYFDDAALAAAYCNLTGSKGQKQFDTVVRNLNNWRSGRHLPRSGNLRVLENLLGLRKGAALQARWQELHRRAKSHDGGKLPAPQTGAPAVIHGTVEILPPSARAAPVPVAASPVASNGRRRWSTVQAALGGIILFCFGVLLGGGVATSGWRPWAGPADNAPIIPFRPDITMKLGDTRPIYAVRGDCGELPEDWSQMLLRLPFVRTGTLSDGGLARRHSKFCQGLTPARAINFTATAAGTEEFEIQGDFFKMTVVE